jgi:hypothetical protein
MHAKLADALGAQHRKELWAIGAGVRTIARGSAG